MNYIAIVYQAFATDDTEIISLSSKAINKTLCHMSSIQIIKLDEQFRRYTSLEWYIDWELISLEDLKSNIRNQEEYLNVIRLGTFHPNGFLREKCLMELSEDPEALPYLLLRLNDWVQPIRDRICGIIKKSICNSSIHNVIAALPFLEKAKKGERRNLDVFMQIEYMIVQKIKGQISDLKIYEIYKYDFHVRKYLYCLLLNEKIVSKEQAEQLLQREKNSSNCKTIIISAILDDYICDLNEIDVYLQNKSAVVRRKALDRKYAILKKNWAGIEKLLLDNSKGFRETVCYIIKKHTDIDIINYYIEHLETEYTRVAILGIGENGNKENVKDIISYLQSYNEKEVRDTLKSLGSCLGTDGESIYWKYIMDPRISVAKSAYNAIRSNEIRYGSKQIYERFLNCEYEFTKRYLVNLLLNESSWSRLPYLLQLYNYEDISLQDKIRKKATQRSCYSKLSEIEAEKLRKIMNDSTLRIPAKLISDIELDLKYVTVDNIINDQQNIKLAKRSDDIDWNKQYEFVEHIGIKSYEQIHFEECKYIWKNWVPKQGQADYLQGELLRQAEKLRNEAMDNGNINWDDNFDWFCDFLKYTLVDSDIFGQEKIEKLK
ncbi:hypothetical protein [Anaerosporobacter sp.]